MKKFLIKYNMIFILFVALTCHATVFAVYEDVNGHWAEKTITNFIEKGYISFEDDRFYPDAEVTRGELAKIVNRYFAYGIVESEEENMKIAVDNGYLTDNSTSEKMTREEFAILICKTLSLSPVEGESNFVDENDISFWARGYVIALEKQDIIIGYPDLTYQPQRNITKAELVTILNRCIGIGGADVELVESEITHLEVGILEMEEGRIQFSPIQEKINLHLDDSITLALKGVGEIENIKFGMDSKDIIDFDQETYQITTLQKGTVEFKICSGEKTLSFQIVVE